SRRRTGHRPPPLQTADPWDGRASDRVRLGGPQAVPVGLPLVFFGVLRERWRWLPRRAPGALTAAHRWPHQHERMDGRTARDLVARGSGKTGREMVAR